MLQCDADVPLALIALYRQRSRAIPVPPEALVLVAKLQDGDAVDQK